MLSYLAILSKSQYTGLRMSSYYLYKAIHFIFLGYTILLTVRIFSSWVPAFQGKTWTRFVSFYTDPYLQIFRRMIPPIGGVLDLSPILGFFFLRMFESVILGFFR
jgi:YggT family protein